MKTSSKKPVRYSKRIALAKQSVASTLKKKHPSPPPVKKVNFRKKTVKDIKRIIKANPSLILSSCKEINQSFSKNCPTLYDFFLRKADEDTIKSPHRLSLHILQELSNLKEPISTTSNPSKGHNDKGQPEPLIDKSKSEHLLNVFLPLAIKYIQE